MPRRSVMMEGCYESMRTVQDLAIEEEDPRYLEDAARLANLLLSRNQHLANFLDLEKEGQCNHCVDGWERARKILIRDGQFPWPEKKESSRQAKRRKEIVRQMNWEEAEEKRVKEEKREALRRERGEALRARHGILFAGWGLQSAAEEPEEVIDSEASEQGQWEYSDDDVFRPRLKNRNTVFAMARMNQQQFRQMQQEEEERERGNEWIKKKASQWSLCCHDGEDSDSGSTEEAEGMDEDLSDGDSEQYNIPLVNIRNTWTAMVRADELEIHRAELKEKRRVRGTRWVQKKASAHSLKTPRNDEDSSDEDSDSDWLSDHLDLDFFDEIVDGIEEYYEEQLGSVNKISRSPSPETSEEMDGKDDIDPDEHFHEIDSGYESEDEDVDETEESEIVGEAEPLTPILEMEEEEVVPAPTRVSIPPIRRFAPQRERRSSPVLPIRGMRPQRDRGGIWG